MLHLQRFYCTDLPVPRGDHAGDAAPVPLSDGEHAVTLDADQTHHARRVLRLEPGAPIELFNGKGTIAEGNIESWAKEATVRITRADFAPPPRPQLELAVCLPKGPRAGDMVNQLSQLGVDRIIPLRTERSVVKPRPGGSQRLQRAAVAAAKQCRRRYLLTVTDPADLGQVLDGGYELKLIADAAGRPLADLADRIAGARRLLILIGPEGGWTEDELATARQAGCLPWCISAHVLRIEAAAAATAAIARYLALAGQR